MANSFGHGTTSDACPNPTDASTKAGGRKIIDLTVEELAQYDDFHLTLIQCQLAIAVGMEDGNYWREEIVSEGPRSFGRSVCTSQAAHDKLMAPYKAFQERVRESRELRRQRLAARR